VGATLAATAIVGFMSGLRGNGQAIDSLIRKLDESVKFLFQSDVMSSAVFVHFRKDGWCSVYNASHAGVMIAREGGGVEFVGSHLPPLGAIDEVNITGLEISLHGEDRVILMNSGSAKGSRGMKNIAKFVASLGGNVDPQTTCERICKKLEEIDQDDDHVVVCLSLVETT
jgi:serine phosphatase RsbU (regulator of sigma subunit)